MTDEKTALDHINEQIKSALLARTTRERDSDAFEDSLKAIIERNGHVLVGDMTLPGFAKGSGWFGFKATVMPTEGGPLAHLDIKLDDGDRHDIDSEGGETVLADQHGMFHAESGGDHGWTGGGAQVPHLREVKQTL
jgi:hypothetical protein